MSTLYEMKMHGSDGWISVKDRLPESGPVMVVCERNRWSMCVGFVRDGALVYAHAKTHPADLDPITHWRELPEPPAADPPKETE